MYEDTSNKFYWVRSLPFALHTKCCQWHLYMERQHTCIPIAKTSNLSCVLCAFKMYELVMRGRQRVGLSPPARLPPTPAPCLPLPVSKQPRLACAKCPSFSRNSIFFQMFLPLPPPAPLLPHPLPLFSVLPPLTSRSFIYLLLCPPLYYGNNSAHT